MITLLPNQLACLLDNTIEKFFPEYHHDYASECKQYCTKTN